jgi:hypothetical protein
MLCLADFNEIIHTEAKLGPSCVDVNRMNALCMYDKQYGCFDLGYNGRLYLV